MPTDANLYSRLAASMTGSVAKIAFAGPGKPAVTYSGLLDRIGRVANALRSVGVEPGDRVTAQVEKSIENVTLYLATLKIGAIFNPLNTAYTPVELEYFIADAEPALLVVSAATQAALAATAAAKVPRKTLTMEADGSGSLTTLAGTMKADCATVPRAAADLAALLYTSGTTGRSKGAMITHENLVSNAETLSTYWRFKPDDVLLHALPIFHVHGLFVALHTAILNANTMLWLDRFDLDAVLELLSQATVMMGVPTFYTRLLGDKRFGREHCRRLRLVISGSAPLLAETHVAFEERTGHKILERYGMTEAGMVTSNPYQDGPRVAGTVGYALPGIAVRVATPEGKPVAAGDVGVLEFKGPNVFKGYWRNPEKTNEEFRSDGFFVSGDLATIAADGRVSIVGRAKDLIISGGFNVYPKEIETEINELPDVGEAAVIGVPHPDFGEGVVAVVTAAAGAAEPPTEAGIIGALAGRLAKFKQPKRVFILPDLPRNAMGKVQKAELRAKFGKTFTSP